MGDLGAVERIGDMVATADAVRDALAVDDTARALRVVTEFVQDVAAAGASRRDELVRPTAPATGRQEWDALLAGVVEMLALRHDFAVPAWTRGPDRFLTRWWTLADRPAAAVSAFTETPAALANRGVFVHASSLEST